MRIGYLDDEYDILKSAMRSLKKYDIEIVALKNIDDVTNITMLTDNIISDTLECLLVDYDLMKLEYKVYGTQIIKDINEILPDFTCFLLTNYTEQGINEKIVQKIFVQDKAIFASSKFSMKLSNCLCNLLYCFNPSTVSSFSNILSISFISFEMTDNFHHTSVSRLEKLKILYI